MTIEIEAQELDERLAAAAEASELVLDPRENRRDPEPVAAGRGDEKPEPRLAFLAAAAALAALGGAWMCGGLFRDAAFARTAGALGAAIGVGFTFASLRLRRASVLQALSVPAAALAGALLVAPAATGGTANLPSLVSEALRDGGLLQPPIPFAPGWRFIIVVLIAAVGSVSLGLAFHLRSSRLVLAIPVPVLVGGALLQPKGTGIATVAVAGALMLAALAFAYGADLPTGESVSAAFETRRLARGAGLVVALLVALAIVARAGFLFPTTDEQRVIPPQRPPAPIKEPDRVLFHVDDALKGPWRVGVLDSYDGEAFLLPPIDPRRVETPRAGAIAAPRGQRPTYDVSFRIADMRGNALPIPASAIHVRAGGELAYDPITESLRLAGGRPRAGYTYTVTAQDPPDGKQLAAEQQSQGPTVAAFKAIPPPPNEVVALLSQAPAGPFDRLQFIRQALYNNIVAAGPGTPVEVTPARVGAMLRSGAEATPFEISAAEVLLARWAGVPARLGFGFYGGEAVDGKAGLDFRPRHGAAWLEAWFDDYGWTPLVGTPPKAKAGLDDNDKNQNENVSASQDLALVVFVPVKLSAVELLSERVRYWALTALPLIAVVLALAAGWPVVAKLVRRSRRRRWAASHGPAARIWAAYAELRDSAHDLNIGDHAAPPLEFCDYVDADDEHSELAWLVTRALWGDLARDLRVDDAEAGEEMARSVRARLVAAQPFGNRVAASVSRASLTNPFTRDVPDLGIHPTSHARPWRMRAALGAIVAVIAIGTPIITAQRSAATADAPSQLPRRLAPAQIGQYDLVRARRLDSSFRKRGAASAVRGGAVYTIESGPLVAGSFQVAVLRPDVDASDEDTRRQLTQALLSGDFRLRFYGPVSYGELHTAEQQAFVWFPPSRNVMEMWVFRADVPGAAQLVRQHMAFQLGWTS